MTGEWSGLAAKYGTPMYVYQLDEVRQAATDLRRALPADTDAYYSLKANPHPLVAAAAARSGFGLEISSEGELAAITHASLSSGRCLYTGPAKTVSEMVRALRAGVRLFSVESRTDLARLLAATEQVEPPDGTVEYLLRLRDTATAATAGLRMTGTPTQFGMPITDLLSQPSLLDPGAGVRPAGFHLFSASNISDDDALLAALTANAATVAEVSAATGFRPRIVDIGGGFAAPFARPGRRPVYRTLRAGLTEALDEYLPDRTETGTSVAVESGRHLVATAGTLLTTVMDIRVAGGRTHVLCDAGVNTLGGMSGLGRLLPAAAQPEGHADGADVTLTGPLCTPLDVLSRGARLDRPRIGDVLAVPNVGAYGLSASLVAFLGRPMPIEVVRDGTDVVDVRRLRFTSAAP